MKKRILSVVLILPLLLTGCFGYNDMNRVNFVASGVIDEDESDNVIIYDELFSGDRGDTTQGAMSKRIILKGEGLTINQAFYDMQKASNYPMTYDVMKSLIFTERLAQHGLTDHLDTIMRNQKPTIKIFVFILEGDPAEFYSIQLEDEQFTGVFLENMMIMQGDQQNILSVRLNELYNERVQPGGISLIPTIALSQGPGEKRVEVTGVAVLKDDKMVEKLDIEEVAAYKAMTNKIEGGNLTVENPEESGKLLSLLILKNKTKQDIAYDGEKATLKIKIDMTSSIMGIEGKTEVMDDEKEITDAAVKEVKKKGEELFYRFQKQNIDLFHIETAFNRKYPDIQVSNILENAEIELDVKIDVESSQNITDFQQ